LFSVKRDKELFRQGLHNARQATGAKHRLQKLEEKKVKSVNMRGHFVKKWPPVEGSNGEAIKKTRMIEFAGG